ncbi:hypothetical protein GQ44DRAFT_766994 [Phaeosphaeriaceae sp. PMI808]|nr:hypothetical protein GQ44DRAFT_766994 [Phaeosphaeriaceae sp. PMI808]
MHPSSCDLESPFSPPQRWGSSDDAQLVHRYIIGEGETRSASGEVTTGRRRRESTSGLGRELTQLDSDRLGFLLLAEWDEYNSYDEDTSSRLRYSTECKVAVNNRVVAKDTEQDLVSVPAAHWHLYLKPKVEKLLNKKLAHNRHLEFGDTSVVVSVNDRSQRDLTKRFDDMDVDWSVIER